MARKCVRVDWIGGMPAGVGLGGKPIRIRRRPARLFLSLRFVSRSVALCPVADFIYMYTNFRGLTIEKWLRKTTDLLKNYRATRPLFLRKYMKISRKMRGAVQKIAILAIGRLVSRSQTCLHCGNDCELIFSALSAPFSCEILKKHEWGDLTEIQNYDFENLKMGLKWSNLFSLLKMIVQLKICPHCGCPSLEKSMTKWMEANK